MLETSLIEPNFVTTKTNNMKRIIFFAILLSIFLGSCHYVGGKRISGNGKY